MPKNLVEVYSPSLSEIERDAAQGIVKLITKDATGTNIKNGPSLITLELSKIDAALKSAEDTAILNIFHRQNQQNKDKPAEQYKWVISQLEEMGIPAIVSSATGNGKDWQDAIAAGFPDKYIGSFGPAIKGELKNASYQYDLIYAGMKKNFLIVDLVMMKVTETSGEGMDIWGHHTDLFYVTLDVVKIAKYIGAK